MRRLRGVRPLRTPRDLTVDWSTLARPGARPLRPAQRAFLDACWSARVEGPGPWGPRGVVGLLGCGHGKTLSAQLAPLLLGARRPLLLVPAALVAQTARDVAEWRAEYPVAAPRVATYELLSHPRSGPHLLDDAAPDLVVLDEAHLLGNPEGARWVRLARYLQAHPSCRVVALSGTLTWRSLRQVAHVLHAALRDRSPIPPGTLDALAAVLDVGGAPAEADWQVAESVLGRLPARTKEQARTAFHARLATTPGVVVAAGVAADVSLTIDLVRPALPDGVRAALARLATRWELPDGVELVDAIEVHRAARSLAWGWWSRWVEGADRDPRWAPWFGARAAWGAAVRDLWYSGRAESPGVAADLARRGALAAHHLAAWTAWEAVRDPEPAREVAWVDGGRAWVAEGARLARPGELVWYSSTAVEEALRAAGWHVHGAGSAPPTPGPRRAASWRVHGKGWNGQGFPKSLILETPDGAGAWEQLLARSHRPGQREDVEVRVVVATEAVEGLLGSALAGAHYAADVLGQPQRLTLASWPSGRPVG